MNKLQRRWAVLSRARKATVGLGFGGSGMTIVSRLIVPAWPLGGSLAWVASFGLTVAAFVYSLREPRVRRSLR